MGPKYDKGTCAAWVDQTAERRVEATANVFIVNVEWKELLANKLAGCIVA